MSFSVAEFQSAVDKINGGMDDISAKMDEMPQKAHDATDHWYIPGFIKDAVNWMVEKMHDLATKIWDKLTEFLRGVAAPIYFWNYRSDLQTVVDKGNNVASKLTDAEMAGTVDWEGKGADAYRRQISPQNGAAAELASQAEGFRGSLLLLAIAGLVFYVGVGVIVVKFVAALIACLVALGTVVFSWAGLALICEEAGVNIGALLVLAGTLATLVGDQVKELTAFNEAMSSTAYPGGMWPKGHTGQFSDGTVKDGDNDWSLGG